MTIKPLYCEAFNKRSIRDFIEEARSQYYADHGNAYELIKNMGKAIAYAEAAWAMTHITEAETDALTSEAEAVIKEIIY